MQLGFTLYEKMNLDNGQVTNASLADYKIPGIGDLPAVMINEAIDAYQHNAPFGAKGVGESSTLAGVAGDRQRHRRRGRRAADGIAAHGRGRFPRAAREGRPAAGGGVTRWHPIEFSQLREEEKQALKSAYAAALVSFSVAV